METGIAAYQWRAQELLREELARLERRDELETIAEIERLREEYRAISKENREFELENNRLHDEVDKLKEALAKCRGEDEE